MLYIYIYYKTYFNNGIIKEIDYKKKKNTKYNSFSFLHGEYQHLYEIYSTGGDDFRLFSSKNV